MVGRIISVFWAEGHAGWYDAVVVSFSPETGLHRIDYLDGDCEHLDFSKLEKPWEHCKASTKQVMDAFEIMLKYGDIPARDFAREFILQLEHSRSSKGFSALHLAVSKGHAETVAFLLRSGLDPDSPCGRLSLSARGEAESQKGKGGKRMEIYRLMELHKRSKTSHASASAAVNTSMVDGTPAPGCMDRASVSPIAEKSMDISIGDVSLVVPTPNAELAAQLLKGSVDLKETNEDFLLKRKSSGRFV